MHAKRGQVLPLWIASMFAMLMFAGFIVNYGYSLTLRIRAQSAADSAAHGVLAAHVQQFNAIQALLFASWVEEVRARHLVGAITLVSRRSGDCTDSLSRDLTCGYMYPRLYQAYRASVARYTFNVFLMGELTSVKYNDVVANAKNYITNVAPANIGVNDANFKYTLLNYGPREDPLRGPWSTNEDALTLSPGATMNNSQGRIGAGLSANPFWIPPEAEVVACLHVPSPFRINLFGFKISAPDVYGIGRAAATAMPVTSEWMSPAMISLNAPGNTKLDKTVLLPAESWDSVGYDSGENMPNATAAGRPSYQGDGWYDLTYDDYANTPNSVDTSRGPGQINLSIQGHTFTTAMNWWSVTNISSYLGKLNLTSANLGSVCN